MKLYQTVDGTLIGFYQESGGAVQCTKYRDVFEQQLVEKKKEEQVMVPGYFKTEVTTEPGYWKEEIIMTPGHYELETKTWEEYTITKQREIDGHFEIKPVWIEEQTVTKYYWREAHLARGLEAAWIPYQEVIPGYYKDQKVWVDAYTEEYDEIVPAGSKSAYVWRPGYGTPKKVWVPPAKKAEQVWIEPHFETKYIVYKELEDVWIGREPIYEYVNAAQITNFEVLSLIPGPAGQISVEDQIILRNTLTGEDLITTARYLGLATRIDENEYVVV